MEKLYESIWYGTKNLITRSKLGQRPLLLLLVDYTTEHANSYVGRLDRFLSVKAARDNVDLRDEQIRDVSDVTLDLAALAAALENRGNKIDRIRVAHDERLKLSPLLEEPAFGRSIELLSFD